MFHCPYPGCNRKFYELARLKEHHRAPPDRVKKAKGHGKELDKCPKCGEMLEKGKRHFGCDAERKGWDPVNMSGERRLACIRKLFVCQLCGANRLQCTTVCRENTDIDKAIFDLQLLEMLNISWMY